MIKYDPLLEKESIAKCLEHTIQQLKTSPNLYPLSSSYDYHIFFFNIPYQDLDKSIWEGFKKEKILLGKCKRYFGKQYSLKVICSFGGIGQRDQVCDKPTITR